MFATQNSPIRFRQAFGVLLVVASLSCGAAYPPLTGQGATNSQSAYQAQIQQQQLQLQQQLAERRQAVAQQQQDQARQEQARQQQIQLQQQLAERRQAVAQQQQDQARQEQARQQQIQLQQQLAERRQAVAQQQQDQARQEQARQQQIQLQQQLAERRQAVVQQQQDQARQEQARQQQIQLQQQLAERREAVVQQQLDQARQYQARQQQIQLQQQLAERRQSVAQQQAPASTYKDPNNAKIGPATAPSYAAGQDWRGYYAEVPRVVPNQVTGAGSLSTNQGSTIQYDRRHVGSDNAYPLDAAKTVANYVNTHREDTLMNGMSMLVGVGEVRAGLAGVEVAGKTALNAMARKETSSIAGEGMAGATAKQIGGAVRNVNPLNGDMNCVNCAVALDYALRGHPSSALLSGKQPITAIEEHYGRKFAEPSTIGNIVNEMAKAGKGAAGIVYGAPKNGTVGHVFNVVNQRGVVRFLDGQDREYEEAFIVNGYKYFQLIRTK